MLAAVKGIIHGNTVVIEDEDIRQYEGVEAVVPFCGTTVFAFSIRSSKTKEENFLTDNTSQSGW